MISLGNPLFDLFVLCLPVAAVLAFFWTVDWAVNRIDGNRSVVTKSAAAKSRSRRAAVEFLAIPFIMGLIALSYGLLLLFPWLLIAGAITAGMVLRIARQPNR